MPPMKPPQSRSSVGSGSDIVAAVLVHNLKNEPVATVDEGWEEIGPLRVLIN